MPETIEAEELALGKIFDDKYRFLIPDYQRPYAWTTEETAELLDDVRYAASTVNLQNGDVQKASPYFLGSIVIVKGDSPQSDVVDGQQRITTLTILFCVLRELASEESNGTIHEFIREKSNRFSGVTGDFRLSVRERDQDFFRSHIQEPGKLGEFVIGSPSELSDSQTRMHENAKYLWQQLSNIDENQRDILTSFLVQRCYLVVVSTSDQSSAYRIFSVLNDRGLDLSPTDILKSQIIGTMDKTLRRQYSEMWEDHEDDIGRENFRDLFAHIRMIFVREKLRRTLQEEFQERVLNEITGVNFIDDVLVPYSDVYKKITDASYESPGEAEKVNTLLRHLNRLDNFDWIPVAMEFFKCNYGDIGALIRFTRDLERLAYGLFIRRANINERIRRYAEVLHAIETDVDLSDSDSPLQLRNEEKEEILRVLDGPIYSYRSRFPQPILLCLDRILADSGASYDYSVITVEHVLPQNPTEDSEWMRDFPDQDEREQWTHRLANLVLLSRRKNSRAANYDFIRKKREYFQQDGVPPFALTTQVVNESEWTPEVLRRRQHSLIEAFKKDWRLD